MVVALQLLDLHYKVVMEQAAVTTVVAAEATMVAALEVHLLLQLAPTMQVVAGVLVITIQLTPRLPH